MAVPDKSCSNERKRTQVKTTKEDTTLLGAEHIVYGRFNRKGNLYVELFKNSPFLACTDLETANEELIDPVFVWLGPNDRLRGHISANLTETGKLMMKAFRKSMSGSHNCMVRYLSIKNGNTVKSFSFTFGTGSSSTPKIYRQVRDQIVDFFLHFSQVQRKQFLGINYVEHSLDIRRLDSCRPGFGRNQEKQNDCCVICQPGTFSQNNRLYCEICEDIQIDNYGANHFIMHPPRVPGTSPAPAVTQEPLELLEK
ncbi:LOW QUALITY PROTEIN: zona pellucida-binding protein 2 [Xenopus tropicalis]|uniref:LOW QUALITY PROTEIN: zona pellucida-binding protein 2 n=1 Tax=Xenopus tropicalis TaxID=8364 RepID=A0A8J1IXX8_XENTR|nr:LOW QUALITY PROTEIN: zona pellucida-binding protein 2 [Xenopus tropicalis]